MERAAAATTGIKRLPSRPQTDPAESSAALVSVSRSSFMIVVVKARDGAKGSERGCQDRAGQVEDGEERAHDGGGSGDDDPGDNAHLAVRVALADGVRARPDFDHAPEESEHEEDSEGRAEALLQCAGGVTARGLGENGR
jgi:hypothetical protein